MLCAILSGFRPYQNNSIMLLVEDIKDGLLLLHIILTPQEKLLLIQRLHVHAKDERKTDWYREEDISVECTRALQWAEV